MHAINKKIIKNCVVIFNFVIYFLFFQNYLTAQDIRTPEGYSLYYWTESEFTPPQIAAHNRYSDSLVVACGLNAVRIGDASYTYSCHGYAWCTSEGNIPIHMAGDIIYYFNDAVSSNDGLPSYLPSGWESCSEAEATHVLYLDNNHSARKIQNSYPRPIEGGRDYVSKWGIYGLYQHAKGNDIYYGWDPVLGCNPQLPQGYLFKKLKTTHYGALSTYPKTWIGAGGRTHTVTGNLTVNSSLKIMPGATVNFQSGVTMTVNGTLYVNSNLTIPSGVTLVVNPGAVLQFASGISLIINGTMNANGADFNNISGTWSGIKFYSGSSGSLSYCTIQNAQYGVYCNGYLPNITNCTIANNYIGINLYNTGVQTNNIANNTIRNNSNQGINMTNSSPRNIYGNQIYSNGQAGIYCINYSIPYIYNNQITGNGAAGITCALYSPARLGTYAGGGGYNLITGNYWGVGCGYESHAILGTTSGYGYNSIHSNTYCEVKGDYDSDVMAENNWWNRPSPPYYSAGDFCTSFGGTIDYIPALSYNPLGGLMKAASSEYNSDISNEDRSYSFIDSELREALDYLVTGKYEEAIIKYEERYKKETDIGKKKYILGRLAECYNLSEKKGFIGFLNNEVRRSSEGELSRKAELYATSLFLENMQLIKEKNYEQAVDNLEILLKDFPGNDAVVKPALFNLVCLNHHQTNNVSQGNKYLEVLKSKYPNDELTFQAMLTIGEFEDNHYPKPESTSEETSIQEISKTYSLLENYPNPFNPTTVINFSLPQETHVTLKVYDILGQEVAVLVNESKPAGEHKALFNAKELPSGVYIYTVKAGTYSSIKKMLLVK